VIIAVMADKGGVGKTTTAHNLGAEITHKGMRTLLIDADKQADLTELVGLGSEPNIGVDAILLQRPTPDARPYVRTISPGLDIIGTHPHMRKADRDLAQRTRREYVLEESLSHVLGDYQFVIIDVGHSEMAQLNVMALCDVLVVPTTPAKLDADHIINMLEEADLMRRDLRLPSLMNPRRVVVSVTRRSPNAGIEATGLDLIRERFAHVLAPAIIPATPRVVEASAMKMSLRDYRDRHGTARDKTLTEAVDAFAALAEHILQLVPAMEGVA
jgi:chromosome partitioning protein